jgi:hypothetical protein
MNRHERAFRRLVRLFPAAFREQYEDQMTGLFADQVRDARASGSPFALTRLWAHTLIDLMATAPRQHLREQARVLQPVESANVPAKVVRAPLLRVIAGVAAVAVVLWFALWIVAPGFMDPVFDNPPAVLGLPAGVSIIAFAEVLALLGWLVTRRAQTLGVALGALAFLTLPAIVLILMAPALILSILELAV